MFLIKKAVFKPIDCKDSANALRAPAKKCFFLGIFVKINVNLRKLLLIP